MSLIQSYKMIFFDLDDTLIDFVACEQQVVQATLHYAGVSRSDSVRWDTFLRVYERINTHYWRNREQFQFSRFELVEKSFSDTFAELGHQGIAMQSLPEFYWDSFNRLGILTDGSLDVLEQLHGQLPLGLITNGYKESQRSRLDAAGIRQYFDTIVVSEEVGVQKPNPEIFRIALKDFPVSPAEALFVGDSLYHDGQGAQAAGMDFCWFNPKQRANEESIPTKFIIRRLPELLHYL